MTPERNGVIVYTQSRKAKGLLNMRLRKVTTREVADCWSYGQAASNSGGQFWTDGQRLYSYALLIGDTALAKGRTVKVLRDYSANGEWGYQSQTTSKHVGYARTFADVLAPKAGAAN